VGIGFVVVCVGLGLACGGLGGGFWDVLCGVVGGGGGGRGGCWWIVGVDGVEGGCVCGVWEGCGDVGVGGWVGWLGVVWVLVLRLGGCVVGGWLDRLE